jgi:hypothetical protein
MEAARSLAVDPEHPDVIYMGTGSSVYDGGMGIFKSIDGGATWSTVVDKDKAASTSDSHILCKLNFPVER